METASTEEAWEKQLPEAKLIFRGGGLGVGVEENDRQTSSKPEVRQMGRDRCKLVVGIKSEGEPTKLGRNEYCFPEKANINGGWRKMETLSRKEAKYNKASNPDS